MIATIRAKHRTLPRVSAQYLRPGGAVRGFAADLAVRGTICGSSAWLHRIHAATGTNCFPGDL